MLQNYPNKFREIKRGNEARPQRIERQYIADAAGEMVRGKRGDRFIQNRSILFHYLIILMSISSNTFEPFQLLRLSVSETALLAQIPLHPYYFDNRIS